MQRRRLQQLEHFDELAGPGRAEIGLETTSQDRETCRELPTFQRLGDVERAGLAFQQRQVVARVIRRSFLGPHAPVTSDHGRTDRDADLVDATDNGDVVMRVRGRDRVIVAVEPHQRQRVHLRGNDPSNFEHVRG